MWPSRSRNVSDDSKAPYGYLIPHIFLWSYLFSLLFAPTIIHHFRQYVYQLPLIVFDRPPGKRLFSLGKLQVRLSKNSLVSKNHQTGKTTTSLWQWVSAGTPTPLRMSKNCQADVLHHDYRLLFFKATIEFGMRVWEWGKLKCHSAHSFYWDSTVFTDSGKPLVNSQSSEKDSENVCHCSHFMEGRMLKSPYSTIVADIFLFSLNMFCFVMFSHTTSDYTNFSLYCWDLFLLYN